MKRQGQLIEDIADFENLQLAFYKAKKGKSEKTDVLEYGKRLQDNLLELRQQILDGNIETGSYRYFTIYDPKKRHICAAPFGQRVLHHALMNICHPVFEKVQVFDSYASRVNKGTYVALERARHFTKHYKWYLKLDFRKYFDNLDHKVLKKQLIALFKDNRLLDIFNNIIDSYSANINRGVPIGNLTSQYFANHYLSRADHYAKESLKIRAYVRYMDDIVLWHNNKNILMKAGLDLRQFAKEELSLELKPFCLNRSLQGVPFLSYLLYPDNIRLAHRSRKRFIKKMIIYKDKLDLGLLTQKEYQNHVLPLIAFTEYANAREFRKRVINDA